MEMHFCPLCGTRLKTREHPTDGIVAYCERCGDYRFPHFSTAVSIVVLNVERTQMILIRQYGEPWEVLAAGYVDKGETAEDAVRREVREELGMSAGRLSFIRSRYYAPSETLMLLYEATAAEESAAPNWEVDGWEWVPVGRARELVKPGGLAESFLSDYEKHLIQNEQGG